MRAPRREHERAGRGTADLVAELERQLSVEHVERLVEVVMVERRAAPARRHRVLGHSKGVAGLLAAEEDVESGGHVGSLFRIGRIAVCPPRPERRRRRSWLRGGAARGRAPPRRARGRPRRSRRTQRRARRKRPCPAPDCTRLERAACAGDASRDRMLEDDGEQGGADRSCDALDHVDRRRRVGCRRAPRGLERDGHRRHDRRAEPEPDQEQRAAQRRMRRRGSDLRVHGRARRARAARRPGSRHARRSRRSGGRRAAWRAAAPSAWGTSSRPVSSGLSPRTSW